MIWWIVVVCFIVLIIVARTKKRGYLMKDKQGNPVTVKNFFVRWGQGIEGITPLQQSKTQIMGLWIVVSGVLAGMIINALVRMSDQWWWIEVVLAGSLVLTTVQFISTYQRYRKFKITDKVMKELNKTKVVRGKTSSRIIRRSGR